MDEDFRLPINHQITENLDRDNLEQASMDKQIDCNNVGFQLLVKMGWKGKGLGKQEQGIIDPVRTTMREFRLGLGKQEQDDFYTAEENIERRKLASEVELSEEDARRKEEEAERAERIKQDVKEIQRVFFCELCNKQYKLASEFETHLSSYDHNHKKRFRDMKAMQSGPRDERQKKEKEREDKEMARYALLVKQREEEARQAATRQTGVPSSIESVSQSSAGTVQPAAAIPSQRAALKFGMAMGMAKGMAFGKKAAKKAPAKPVASIFGAEDDDEEFS